MAKAAIHNRIRRSRGEEVFNVFNILFMIFLMLICVYPFWYVIMGSFSRPSLILGHKGGLLWPLGFSLTAYETVFANKAIWMGYYNTIIYVVGGTIINIILTVMGAYYLSRRFAPCKKFVMILIMFTMYFSGGMIPGFLNIRNLGLLDTRWAILLPGAVSTFNLIIMRTAFASIDTSMEESAMLDGAGHWTIMFRIMLPLAKATIAVLVLYYGVAHWNSWFSAMLYLDNEKLKPLQLVLREILIINTDSGAAGGEDADSELLSETIKYATILVATVPILCLYPFLQKYFVKGMMVGAIKG